MTKGENIPEAHVSSAARNFAPDCRSCTPSRAWFSGTRIWAGFVMFARRAYSGDGRDVPWVETVGATFKQVICRASCSSPVHLVEGNNVEWCFGRVLQAGITLLTTILNRVSVLDGVSVGLFCRKVRDAGSCPSLSQPISHSRLFSPVSLFVNSCVNDLEKSNCN